VPRIGKPTQWDGYCGAETPKGKHATCHNRAGYRTNHPGIGRCHRHGGCSPVKSGLYSTVMHEQFRDVYHEMLDQKEPMASVDEEIAFLRICAMRLQKGADALLDVEQRQKAAELGLELGILDTHASRTLALSVILERITRAVHRKVEIEQSMAIRLTPMQLTQFTETFKAIVDRYVTDERIRKSIAQDLSTTFGGDRSGRS